ncbi:hypothetical protein BV25DRAFT_1922678 [Artomyces pyxidatus]|uniref:Uncharacterized protein n=1 Tax=Artomyces pyxidatus TaxID=48021 RepID=A0ACB8SEY7_9AGAM|nr:hypothetical protein BV25DRAFT_1922678 [Artomyces pyxidatus]
MLITLVRLSIEINALRVRRLQQQASSGEAIVSTRRDACRKRSDAVATRLLSEIPRSSNSEFRLPSECASSGPPSVFGILVAIFHHSFLFKPRRLFSSLPVSPLHASDVGWPTRAGLSDRTSIAALTVTVFLYRRGSMDTLERLGSFFPCGTALSCSGVSVSWATPGNLIRSAYEILLRSRRVSAASPHAHKPSESHWDSAAPTMQPWWARRAPSRRRSDLLQGLKTLAQTSGDTCHLFLELFGLTASVPSELEDVAPCASSADHGQLAHPVKPRSDTVHRATNGPGMRSSGSAPICPDSEDLGAPTKAVASQGAQAGRRDALPRRCRMSASSIGTVMSNLVLAPEHAVSFDALDLHPVSQYSQHLQRPRSSSGMLCKILLSLARSLWGLAHSASSSNTYFDFGPAASVHSRPHLKVS